MDGTSAWLLLSLWVATPQPPPQGLSAPDASGARTLVARAETSKKAHKRAHDRPDRAKALATPGQPATPSPQLQSKRTLLPLPTAYRAVALWPLSYDEADTDIALEFEAATSDAIEAVPNSRVISARDVESDLDAQGERIDSCDRDVTCMARLGRMARAHLVLEIRLVPTGGITTVQARLIDTLAQREVLRLDEPLQPTAAERGEQVHGLVTQLLNPSEYIGSLQVRCDARGAQVFLDGVKVGEAPLPPMPRVTAGVHILRVVRPGHADVHRFIDVQFGRANIVTVHDVDDRLTFESVMQDVPVPPAPPAPVVYVPPAPPHAPSWRTWTAVGLASAGALGLGAGGYLAAELKDINAEQRRDVALLTALQLGDPQSVGLSRRLAHLNGRGPKIERGQWVAIGAGAGLLGVGAALVTWDFLRVRLWTPPAGDAADTPAADAAIKPVAVVPTWMGGYPGLRLDMKF